MAKSARNSGVRGRVFLTPSQKKSYFDCPILLQKGRREGTLGFISLFIKLSARTFRILIIYRIGNLVYHHLSAIVLSL